MTISAEEKQQHFEQIIRVFSAYLSDPSTLARAIKTQIDEAHLDVNDWQFTLAELHAQCACIEPHLAKLSYKVFRQLLYTNPTHEIVKSLGGVFTTMSAM